MRNWIAKYNKRFEEGFPMFQLCRTRSESEVIEIIKHCLKENKDVYELNYVTDDEDVLY